MAAWMRRLKTSLINIRDIADSERVICGMQDTVYAYLMGNAKHLQNSE
jgi:hypothetical protein